MAAQRRRHFPTPKPPSNDHAYAYLHAGGNNGRVRLARSPFGHLRHRCACRLPLLNRAPLTRDYLYRNRIITFYEHEVTSNPNDQIKMRMLAGMYLQRFREQYDFSDVDRAERLAKRSLELQPRGILPPK